MSVIAQPTDLMVGDFGVGQARYEMREVSDATGDEAARLFGPPRWRFSLSSPEPESMSLDQAAAWEAMQLRLRGGINHLEAFDPVRYEPQGTLRGSPRLQAAVAAGATSMTLIGGLPGTLKAADWLQIGTGLGTSQLVKVVITATSSPSTQQTRTWRNSANAVRTWVNSSAAARTWAVTGTISVTFEPPLRLAFAKDTAVTYTRPKGYFKVLNDQPQSSYARGIVGQGGFALDLIEVFN